MKHTKQHAKSNKIWLIISTWSARYKLCIKESARYKFRIKEYASALKIFYAYDHKNKVWQLLQFQHVIKVEINSEKAYVLKTKYRYIFLLKKFKFDFNYYLV